MIARAWVSAALAVVVLAACGPSSPHTAQPAVTVTPPQKSASVEPQALPTPASVAPNTTLARPAAANNPSALAASTPSAVAANTDTAVSELDGTLADLDHALTDVDRAASDASQNGD